MFYLPVEAEVGSTICFGDNQFVVQAGSYIEVADNFLAQTAAGILNLRPELITSTPPVSGGGVSEATTPPAEEKAAKPINDTPAPKNAPTEKE